MQYYYLFMRLLVAFTLCVGVIAPAHVYADARTDSLRAAYIYYFARFTTWENPEKSGTDNVSLCAYVANESLDKAFVSVVNKSATRRTVLEYKKIDKGVSLKNFIKDCHIIYLDESFPKEGMVETDTLFDAGVMLVTEKKVEGDPGVIQFVMSNKKLGFEIDRGLAAKADLNISSKLLSLATRLIE